jgi:nucleoside-diphosphate-sugar epimerase
MLLTGAGGFLGRRLAESLLAGGVDQLRLHFRHRAPAGLLEDLRTRHPQALIEPVAANLASRQGLQEMIGEVDCIVHAAAGMRGATADMFANTVVGTRNLLEAAGGLGVPRIVLVSSFAVFRTVDLPRGAVLSESCAVEGSGVEKGAYGFAKTRQEQLFREMQARFGFDWPIVRPGVIHGPGGSALSPRVGLRAMGLFFSLGGSATLPLSYVENCADAIALVALRAPSGSVFIAVDDDLPTCADYLRAYRQCVRLRVVPVPYWLLLLGASGFVRYNRVSGGQLPAIMTPYTVRSMFRPLRYSNQALKDLGWRQRVPTAQALERLFSHLREQQGLA